MSSSDENRENQPQDLNKGSPSPCGSSDSNLQRALADAICHMNSIDELRVILASGARVNEPVALGLRPLHYACWQGFVEAAHFLLVRGAKVDALDDAGYSAMHLAAEHGRVDLIKLLLNYQAEVNFTRPGETCTDRPEEPLRLAIRNDHYEAARLLLEVGAYPNTRYFLGSDINFVSPTNVQFLSLLLSFGAFPNTRDRDGVTPLMKASRHSSGIQSVLLLLDHGANINARAFERQDCRSVLHFAVLSGNAETVDLLLKQGANVNFEADYNQPTPLHLAILKGNAVIVELLLRAGSDPNWSHCIVGSPLHILCSDGIQNRERILILLLQYGADPNAVTHSSSGVALRAPLAEYMMSNAVLDVRILSIFLRYGAKVVIRSEYRDPAGIIHALPALNEQPEAFEILTDAAEAFDAWSIQRASGLRADMRRLRTTNELISALEEADSDVDDVYAIVIDPPDVREETDEDSGDEETQDTSHLNRHQLQARAHFLRRRNGENFDDDDETEDEAPATPLTSPQAQPGPSSGQTLRRRGTCRRNQEPRTATASGASSDATIGFVKPVYEFRKKGNLPSKTLPMFPGANYSKYRDFSPRELMELFWSDDFLEDICEEVSSYCIFKGYQDINPSVSELRVFLAILLLSGYCPFPQRWMYWCKDYDMGNTAVQQAMRKNRFNQYMQFLHFADNGNLDKEDKYGKLRPLISHLQLKFMEHFQPTQHLSHDEALIEYFGRSSMKQHIIQKPIRFGYKVWSLNTPEGYLVSFEPYQGKSGQHDVELGKIFGKCASTVLSLMERLSDDIKDLPFHVTFDNLFTSFDLLVELKRRGWNGTGTMRSNRIPRTCPLKSPEVMKKEPRGSMSCVQVTGGDSEISLVRWMDNNIVTTASTVYGSEPIRPVSRYSQALKTRIDVPAPDSIRQYNSTMGGTDRMDQNVNTYRTNIRGKKWWFAVFTWLLDVSVTNAWCLGRKAGSTGTNDLLSFRRSIATFWLGHYGSPPSRPGPLPNPPAAQDLRFDGKNHLIQKAGGDTRRRCQGEHCSARTIYECCKCNIGL
ncbi:unnamed protein product [Cyprideis torosa]|uniref:Uncharacterized protein n=1 Tax=Cyprideis torosa TaxID=163714 RepID=A0A7R8WHR4_9CRUS|nr:unnamed protein product [Cyprideis torosa]CAG0899708.1 unnamed protein product [Cyprideis torosa]